jgi:hypothetical protein
MGWGVVEVVEVVGQGDGREEMRKKKRGKLSSHPIPKSVWPHCHLMIKKKGQPVPRSAWWS